MKKRECTGDGGTDLIAVSRLAISWNACVCENFLLLKLAVWSSWRIYPRCFMVLQCPGWLYFSRSCFWPHWKPGRSLQSKDEAPSCPASPGFGVPKPEVFSWRLHSSREWIRPPRPEPRGLSHLPKVSTPPPLPVVRTFSPPAQQAKIPASGPLPLLPPSAWRTSSAAPSGLAEMLAPWEDCSWPTTGSRSTQCMLIFSECRRVGPSLFIPHRPSRAWNSPDPESVRHGCWQNEGPGQLRKSWDGRTGPLHRTSF